MLGLGAPIRGRHGTIRNFKTYVGDGTLEDGKRPADSRTLTAFYLVERDSSGADNCIVTIGISLGTGWNDLGPSNSPHSTSTE